LDKPVIAAVRGPVYGIGTALALACDLVVASETTKFSMAFKKVGVVPDGGAIFFLTQYLGIAQAKDLVYTARVVSADEAIKLGLVMRVVPDERLEAEARAWQRRWRNRRLTRWRSRRRCSAACMCRRSSS
jgi:2-(1,2-epoxy-1,2-dihydrophenyl)acetyl-CoA isomerase